MEQNSQENHLDNELEHRLEKDENEIKALFFVGGTVTIIILAGLIGLFFLINSNKNYISSSHVEQNSQSTIPPTIQPTLQEISPTMKKQSNIQENVRQQQAAPLAKEYFVPLGSGSSTASDWTDVPGVQANINFDQYQNIKEVRFEASVYLPYSGQIVSVRLFNKTDKHPVWYSELTSDGKDSSYLISQPVVYDNGEKQYQVQMKTQLQAQANLVQSRIHILLK